MTYPNRFLNCLIIISINVSEICNIFKIGKNNKEIHTTTADLAYQFNNQNIPKSEDDSNNS